MAQIEKALLAGGCFWGMQDILRKIPGVVRTSVGYAGGTIDNPTYNHVRTGKSGHAEAIEIEFDPAQISYEKILEFFFKMHDPTTLNRQGNDVGSQYRSLIFHFNADQQQIAEKIKTEFVSFWKKPLVTEIIAASKFFPAEEYHQDYLEKNPGGYTCHFLRD